MFIDKKIVLVIDNIDRAEADNILFLFKHIGAVFDLPNILYILSYDDKRIKAVFEDEKKSIQSILRKLSSKKSQFLIFRRKGWRPSAMNV